MSELRSRETSTRPSTKAGANTDPDPVFADLDGLYRGNAAALVRAALRLGVELEQAQDLVQEAFLVAHRRREDFIERDMPKATLYSIVLNLHRNRRRATARASASLDAYASWSGAHDTSHFDDPRSEPSLRLDLDGVLAQLDTDAIEVLMLADNRGMTGREIAGQIGLNVHTVTGRLRRARRSARERLGAYQEAPSP